MSNEKDPKQKGALQEKAANWFRRRQTGGGHKKVPWDKKQSNWDYLQNQDPQDTSKYRDVYSDQQLERSKIERTQTFTARRILMIIVAVFVSILLYVVSSGVSYLAYSVGNSGGGSVVVEGYDPTGKTKPYVQEVTLVDGTKYFALDSPTDTGLVNDKRVYYDKKEDVPPPAWYKALEAEYQKKYAENKEEIEKAQKEHAAKSTFGYHLFPRVNNALPALLGGLLLYGIMYPIMRRNYEAQTILERTDDINQYANDRHVALPEEILQHPEFDIFPDVGATSNVQISSLISHFMLSNKGLDPLPFTQRAEKDIVDEDGDILYYKGEALRDEDGNVMTKMMPRIDEAFGEALYKASNQPKEVRKYWDVSSIPYNEGDKYRDRQGGNIKTIGELINKDWQLPWYEPQRPAGFYLCDVAPVNTIKR